MKKKMPCILLVLEVEVRNTMPNGSPLPMPTPWGYAHTGVVWKITKSAGNSTQPTATTTSATAPTGIPGVP
jgi:hypothetical protein